MACVAESYSPLTAVSEYPGKRRKPSSSWDVLPPQLQEIFDENHKKRRKMTSAWDVLPCGLKVQTVGGHFQQTSILEQINYTTRFVTEDALMFSEGNQPSCSYETLDNDYGYVSPPRRADDKDGHYRFEIGESLTSRYRILSKMGEGTFGQVLECWDLLYNDHAAIKIVRGQEKYREEAMIEIEMIQKVSRHDKNGSRFVQMRHWFDYRNHICIVFEKLGSSLYDCLKKNDYRPFPIDVVRDIGRQLLESVAYMHELNLVHTDLKPENILFVSSEIMKVPESKNGSRHSKDYIELPKSNRIKLIDFGSTELEEKYRTSIIQTRHYRAPEVILGLGWDRACDLWSIGCILVELCSGDTLFQTHENLEHLAMMEMVLGPLPYYIIRRSEKRKYFSHGNRLYWPEGASSKESVNKVRNLPRLRELIAPHVIHYGQLLDLLHGLLCFDPSDRMTATEALRHPFFKGGRGN